MMSFCDPDEIAGMLHAANALELEPNRTDAYRFRMGGKNPNFNAGHEEMMAAVVIDNPVAQNRFTDPTLAEGNLIQDQKRTKGQRVNLVSRPSQFFSKKFYSMVDGYVSRFAKQVEEGENALVRYRQEVVPDLREIRSNIDYLYFENNMGKSKADKAAINKGLEEYGLTWKETKEAAEWLHWLEAGHMYQKKPNDVSDAFARIANAQASYNVAWTLYNIGDFLRPASMGVGQKGYLNSMLAGFKEAGAGLKRDIQTGDVDFGGTLGKVKGLQTLEDIRGVKKLGAGEFFSLSTRFMERFTFAKAEALGIDPVKALGEYSFTFAEHDTVPIAYKSNANTTNAQTAVGLGRFMIAELHYNVHNYANILKLAPAALEGKATGEQKQKAVEFMAYNLMKASIFGSGALVPGFAYDGLKELLGEENSQVLEAGLINMAGTALVKVFDEDARFSMTEAMQPAGLLLGLRPSQLSSEYNKAMATLATLGGGGAAETTPETTKAFTRAVEFVLAIGAVSSLVPASIRNSSGPVGMLGKLDESTIGKALPWLENAQLRRTMKAIIKNYREDTIEDLAKDVAASLLGRNTVKADE